MIHKRSLQKIPHATAFLALLAVLLTAPRLAILTLSNMGMIEMHRAQATSHGATSPSSELSVAWLQRAAALDSPISDAIARRQGQALLLAGQPRQSVGYLLRASHDGRDEIAIYWLGLAYEQIGDFEQAAQVWLSVNFQGLLLRRGESLASAGKTDLAEAIYEDILNTFPESIPALLGQGRIAKINGNWPLAAAAFDKVLAIAPESVDGLVERGITYYYGDNDIDSAFVEFQRAVQLAPQCYWCYLTIADIAKDGARYEDAVRALDSAQTRNFQADSLLYGKQAQIFLENLGDSLKAKEATNKGLAKYPQDANLYYWLGRAEAGLANHSAAISALTQATMLAPDNREYREALDQID